jgi:hypothetical protein
MDLLHEIQGCDVENNKEVDIADLRQKYQLVVFIMMRNNAGENKSQGIIDFIESM